jgi:hypothetical protein
MTMNLPGWLKHNRPETPSSRFHKHAARLTDSELRSWGTTVGQHAAQRCELAALDPRDDAGEIRESAHALHAIADELDKRAAAAGRG